jgi:hypothetical protein
MFRRCAGDAALPAAFLGHHPKPPVKATSETAAVRHAAQPQARQRAGGLHPQAVVMLGLLAAVVVTAR